MTNISRRAALRGIALVSATGGAAGVAHATEHPIDRLHGMTDQAPRLMSHYNDICGGRWELRIRADDDPMPIIYMNIDAMAVDPWDNYKARVPARDRLQHHLLCAALTADEMAPQEGGHWGILLNGAPGFAAPPTFSMFRYDPARRDKRLVCSYADGRMVIG